MTLATVGDERGCYSRPSLFIMSMSELFLRSYLTFSSFYALCNVSKFTYRLWICSSAGIALGISVGVCYCLK